eukprot:TRINITY_DN27718_c1_g1_i1.p2 TRINITY_DN27718_c1_g1~~TRINITY_DN27718_c1_g1_i1.p2  ORF type:complete len:109 (+),score=15.24 TRINITY_DN27718_c1_g1_i1:36-362(+)
MQYSIFFIVIQSKALAAFEREWAKKEKEEVQKKAKRAAERKKKAAVARKAKTAAKKAPAKKASAKKPSGRSGSTPGPSDEQDILSINVFRGIDLRRFFPHVVTRGIFP